MKKLMIAVATALIAGTAAAGGAAAAPTVYPITATVNAEAFTECPAAGATPQVEFFVSSSVDISTIDNQRLFIVFLDQNGNQFGQTYTLQNQLSGSGPYPTVGNYLAEGWSDVGDFRVLDPTFNPLRVVARFTIAGQQFQSNPNLSTALVDYECVAAEPPPGEEPPTEEPPTEEPPTEEPPAVLPPPGTPGTPGTGITSPRPPVLPSAGLSGFDLTVRLGSLILLAGVGFLIVARRRRFVVS